MAHTLGVYKPIFYAQEALRVLYKALGMASTVHTGFDEERKSFRMGDTISIRRPGTFTAQNAPSSTGQDLKTETVNITLDQWKDVVFSLTDQELAYTQRRIIDEHIAPAAYALADSMDTALAALYKDIPHSMLAAGANLAAVDIPDARQRLFDQLAPMRDPRFAFMVGGKGEAGLLKDSAFTQQQGAGDEGVRTQISGFIGPKYGFNIFANQNTPTHTPGAIVCAAPLVNGAVAVGGTTVVVDHATALTGNVKAGDTITLTGDSLDYVITADATASGNSITLTISPGARVAIADNSAVVFNQEATKTKQNLAYHRNFAAIAFAPLSELGDGRGAEIDSVVDPVTQMSVRATMWYDGKEAAVYVRLDTLFGVKTLDEDLCVRVGDTP